MQKYQENILGRVNGALAPLKNVQVTVTDTATNLLAALYSDNGVTPLLQPLYTDEAGLFAFYAADGKYTLTYSGRRVTTTTREVILDDPADNPYLTEQTLLLQNGAEKVGFGLRTLKDKLGEMVSVKDAPFNAKGDGVTVDTAAIQAALNSGAKRVTFPSGTYLCGFVTIPSGVKLQGSGTSSVIKAVAGLSATDPLVRNATFTSFTDTDMAIEDIVFDGSNLGAGASQTRFDSLLHFYRVTGLRLRNVTVKNYQYQGIALSGCRRVTIIDHTLTGLGYAGTTSNGGSALWIGNYGTDMSDGVNVLGGDIYGNHWHGIHAAGKRVNIGGGISFRDNGEAHIYAPRTMPDTITSQLQISNFIMDGVRRKDISAHGIETTARNITISNGQITDCDHGGIALQNAQNANVSGVTIWNVNKINGSWGAVDIITDNTAPNQPQNITITGCRAYDDQATPTTQAAVRMQNAGASITGLQMVGNNFGGTFKGGGAAFQPNAKLGAGCKIKGNIGIADNPAGVVFGRFSVSAIGAVSVTGIGFKPVRVKIRALMPGSSLKESMGWISADGTMYSQSLTSTATPAAYSSTADYAVNITNGLGTAEVRATHSSFDADGFTLNFSAVAATTWCVYEAFSE